MADYKVTRKLDPVIAAYIAGLIDGEGTVTLSRRHANEHRQLVVSIANTELLMLEFVLQQIGAGKPTRKRTTSSLHAPSYCYSISNRQALSLLTQITPYLRSHKKQRAELVLFKYERLTPRNGKYNADVLTMRKHFQKQFFAVIARGNNDCI